MDIRRWIPNIATLALAAVLVITQQVWAGPLVARLTTTTTASSKTTINYQGSLTDAGGTPVNDTLDMVFRLYGVEADGEWLWSESHNGVPVADGLFSVLLGGSTTDPSPIPLALFAENDSLWLGIIVGGDQEMTPRERLASAPSAMTVPDGSVTTVQLADDAITSVKIQDGQVGSADLANNAVTSAKIQDGQVGNADLGSNAVNSAKIQDGEVGNADLANNAVNSAKIQDRQVANADLADNVVTSAKIQDGQVGNADLANNAVNSAKIQDGQVGNADLANNAVNSAKIQDGQVSRADLANNAVNSAKIQDGQVTTSDLANGAVTAAKININDHLDMHKKDIVNIANLVLPYNDARAIKYRGSGPYGLAIQTVNDSGQDIVRMELGVGNYPNVHITNARLDMNGNPIINQGAMVEAGLQTADELAAERIDRFQQGDVLCWAGKRLEKCDQDNDRRVVAVADENGKPIVIGAEPIRVVGLVQVGDLLVASDVAGYAMANNQPAPGTVIAKALEEFDGEKGVVKAMVRTP